MKYNLFLCTGVFIFCMLLVFAQDDSVTITPSGGSAEVAGGEAVGEAGVGDEGDVNGDSGATSDGEGGDTAKGIGEGDVIDPKAVLGAGVEAVKVGIGSKSDIAVVDSILLPEAAAGFFRLIFRLDEGSDVGLDSAIVLVCLFLIIVLLMYGILDMFIESWEPRLLLGVLLGVLAAVLGSIRDFFTVTSGLAINLGSNWVYIFWIVIGAVVGVFLIDVLKGYVHGSKVERGNRMGVQLRSMAQVAARRFRNARRG